MNKLISEIAQPVKASAEQNYAVIIADGNNRFGLFDVSTPEEAEKSLNKIATNEDNVPVEILQAAMGVINTLYMTKTGSEWPLFINIPSRDTNVINNSEVDWTDYELTQKNASRPGVIYNNVFLPLDSKSNVKAAADLLDQHKEEFAGLDRVKFASAITQQAEKFEVSVNDTVKKYAFGTLNPEFYELMDERIKIAKDYEETKSLLETLRSNAPNTVPDKIAEALEVTDHMLPFSMKFVTQEKLGSNRPMFYAGINVPDAFNTVYGVQIRPKTLVEKVAGLSDDQLDPYFSKVFVEKLREDPEGVINQATPTVMKTLRNIAI
jgi:hypothetical protein